jgi:metallo-beta-lactamase class B
MQKKTHLAMAAVLASLSCGMADAAAPDTAGWNEPVDPFKVYGNTYYVGTRNLTSILITSDYGHVLIDGGLPESAKLIAANVEKLGFKVTDIKAILQTHAHPDHVGGIAELQRLSGAPVYARRPADEVMRSGKLPEEDPQWTKRAKVPVASNVWVVHGDQLLGVGSVRLRALATPGHTPGGTSWAWESCQDKTCLQMVYADSLNPISGAKYRFSDHPEVVAQFEQSFKALETQPCELMISPHPEGTGFFEKSKQSGGKAEGLKDAEACKKYVASGRQKLADRLAQEKTPAK